jgi:hypothetical protein
LTAAGIDKSVDAARVGACATNCMLDGGLMGRTAFVDRPGPHGMIIVLAGQKEREALLSDSGSASK